MKNSRKLYCSVWIEIKNWIELLGAIKSLPTAGQVVVWAKHLGRPLSEPAAHRHPPLAPSGRGEDGPAAGAAHQGAGMAEDLADAAAVEAHDVHPVAVGPGHEAPQLVAPALLEIVVG